MKSTTSLLILVTLGFLLPSCGTMNIKQYETNFTHCLEADGIAQSSTLGAQIWSILDKGGISAQAIEQDLESALIAVGGPAAEDAASCAVEAWFDQHPAVASAKKSNSQVAAALFNGHHSMSQGRVLAALSAHPDGGVSDGGTAVHKEKK